MSISLAAWLVVALSVVGLAPIPPATANPTDASQLKPGMFLVATPQLAGSLFLRSVIFITDYDTSGTSGVIINRPTNLRLGRLLPELEAFATDRDQLYFGGPIIPRAVFSLIRTPREHAVDHHIVGNISLAAGKDSLVHMLRNAGPEDTVRAYSGYSGWAPGQLEEEIARGSWLVIPADTEIIFNADLQTLWVELIRQWSGQWI